MAPRANWKGFLKLEQVTCAVALYTAASTSERVAFHTINRTTGHRIRREFIDSVTKKPVPRDQQAKGYKTSKGEYIIFEPEEIAAAIPESDKILNVGAFISCAGIDDLYFDRPYYLAPADKGAEEAFSLIRDGLRQEKAAAIAQTVLFRRVRHLLIRPSNQGMIATTLKFDYEVRSATEAFRDVKAIKIKGEMLELAEHIIKTKRGMFDPSKFDDRYEDAVAQLVKAKIEGRKIKAVKAPRAKKAVDLMEALQASARKAA